MVKLKPGVNEHSLGVLQEVGKWMPTQNGRVKVNLGIDGENYSLYAPTAISLQNILDPLEVGKQVEYSWTERTYKGREYYVLISIKPSDLKEPSLIEAVKEAQDEELEELNKAQREIEAKTEELEELVRARGEIEARIKKLQQKNVEAFI